MEFKVFSDANAVARAAAEHIVKQSRDAVARSGGFSIALSGGSTPKLLYKLLANSDEPFRQQIPWDVSHFFFSDERNVPPDDPESNYGMAYEAMFAQVPRTNLYRIRGEKPAAVAAREYEGTLVEVFGPELPDFDVVLLGLGEEGHTASLFPHSPALKETKRLVAAPWVEKLNTYRITMTLPVLNNGKSIVFLVTGASKAEILRIVMNTDRNPDLYPAQAISPTSGAVTWLVDEAAARLCSINNSSNAGASSDLLNKNP
jgi:6-phosphogluconolactonase